MAFPYDVTITGNPLSLVTIIFPTTPTLGTFKIGYGSQVTSSIVHDATPDIIQSALQLLTGLASAIVAGSITSGAGGGIIIQTNDPGPGQAIYITANSLTDQSFNPITPVTSSSIVVDFGNETPGILGVTNNSLTDINGNPVSVTTSGDLVKAAMMIQALSQLTIMNQMPAIIQNSFNLLPTVQTISFVSQLSTGSFSVTFAVTSTPTAPVSTSAAINWNDSNQIIENKINALLPSGSVSISGGLDQGFIVLSFQNVNPTVITVSGNSTGVPLELQTNLAFGAQLDILAKYAGVSRNGTGPGGPVTLNDADLLTLIQFGIIRNNFGSSLFDIDQLLTTFFQGNINLSDNQEMQLSYTVNGAFFSSSLIDCIISQGLLPRPMGVQLASVIVIPANGTFFSFCNASIPTNRTGFGFNDVNSYSIDAPWLNVNIAI